MKTNYKPDPVANCKNCKFSKWLFSAGFIVCLHGCKRIPATGMRAGHGVGECVAYNDQMRKHDAWAESHRIENHGYCDDFIPNSAMSDGGQAL